jgi:hypothetical protein
VRLAAEGGARLRQQRGADGDAPAICGCGVRADLVSEAEDGGALLLEVGAVLLEVGAVLLELGDV